MDKVKWEYNFQIVAECPKCKAKMVLNFATEIQIPGAVFKCPECGNTYEPVGSFE